MYMTMNIAVHIVYKSNNSLSCMFLLRKKLLPPSNNSIRMCSTVPISIPMQLQNEIYSYLSQTNINNNNNNNNNSNSRSSSKDDGSSVEVEERCMEYLSRISNVFCISSCTNDNRINNYNPQIKAQHNASSLQQILYSSMNMNIYTTKFQQEQQQLPYKYKYGTIHNHHDNINMDECRFVRYFRQYNTNEVYRTVLDDTFTVPTTDEYYHSTRVSLCLLSHMVRYNVIPTVGAYAHVLRILLHTEGTCHNAHYSNLTSNLLEERKERGKENSHELIQQRQRHKHAHNLIKILWPTIPFPVHTNTSKEEDLKVEATISATYECYMMYLQSCVQSRNTTELLQMIRTMWHHKVLTTNDNNDTVTDTTSIGTSEVTKEVLALSDKVTNAYNALIECYLLADDTNDSQDKDTDDIRNSGITIKAMDNAIFLLNHTMPMNHAIPNATSYHLLLHALQSYRNDSKSGKVTPPTKSVSSSVLRGKKKVLLLHEILQHLLHNKHVRIHPQQHIVPALYACDTLQDAYMILCTLLFQDHTIHTTTSSTSSSHNGNSMYNSGGTCSRIVLEQEDVEVILSAWFDLCRVQELDAERVLTKLVKKCVVLVNDNTKSDDNSSNQKQIYQEQPEQEQYRRMQSAKDRAEMCLHYFQSFGLMP